MPEEKSNREILRSLVVDLVKEFVASEGGITMSDIGVLFGPPDGFAKNVTSALASLPLKFDYRDSGLADSRPSPRQKLHSSFWP
jgi:hypothetical protein